MKRHKLNFVVDLISLVVFMSIVSTGLLLKFALPPGSGRLSGGGHSGRSVDVLAGLDRHQWGDIHFYLSLAILVLMLIHIALHWRWVKGTFRGMFSRRSEGEETRRAMSPLGWLLFVVTVAALIISIALPLTIKPESVSRTTNSAEATAGEVHISGRITFAEIETATGISTLELKRELGIPESAPDDERLGQLRREYEFEMENVRSAVEKLSRE